MPAETGRGKPRSSASRHSSPLVRNEVADAKEPKEKTVAWEEPGTAPKASYEDHGGAAFGVLEDMQPLGQRPNAKVKARVRAEPLRKSLMGKSLLNNNGHLDVTLSSFESPKSEAEILEEALPPIVLPADDTTDQDYAPKPAKKTNSRRASRGTSAVSHASPAPERTTTPFAPISSHPLYQAIVAGSGDDGELSEADLNRIAQQLDRANFEQIMGHSSSRAKVFGKEDFGAALSQVYEDSQDDERLEQLLRLVILQRATEDEQSEFKSAVKRAKRTLRKVQPEDNSLARSGFQSRSPYSGTSSERPELIPLPSIEKPNADSTRITASHAPAPLDSLKPSEDTRPRRRNQRSLGGRSSAASTMPPPDEVAHADTNGHHMATSAAPTFTSQHLNGDHTTQNGDKTNGASSADVVMHESNPLSDDDSLSDAMSLASAGHVEAGAVATEADTTQASKRSPDAARLDVEDERFEMAKRRRLRETLYKDPAPQDKYTLSHERETKEEAPRALRSHVGTPVKKPTIKLSNGVTSASRSRRSREPTDSPLSDMSLSPPPVEAAPPKPTAGPSTRRAKFKQSPEKKKTQPVLNLSAAGGPPRTSADVEDDDNDSEDNDHCTSCFGTGYLLCCDGCNRAFHLDCIDPPLDVNSSVLDEPWFCHPCVAKRKPPPRQPRGLFAPLLQDLEKKNSVVFTLPDPVRNYFVNVNTGKDGRFEDVNNAKTRTSRVGVDEPMDLGKLKDSKGHLVLCFHCGRSAAGKRPIIPCDICGNWWHLDCTNPPLANPPCRDQWGRKARDWMCPLHIEHDLSAMDPLRLARQRRFYLRRPKAAKTISSSLRRGHINNGLIEVVDDSSSSDDDFSEFDDTETDNGTIVRLPAQGIKLDFIDKVHQVRIAEEGPVLALPRPKKTRIDSTYLRATLSSRPVLERHTLLSLVQLASEQKDVDITGNALESLIDTMVAEAPPEVLAQVVKDEDVEDVESVAPAAASVKQHGLASPPASNGSVELSAVERRQLEHLMALVQQRLGRDSGGGGSSVPA